MRFAPSLTKLSLGACVLLTSATGSIAVACSADNCLRALFPTATPSAVSSALAFCATYTTTVNTFTTGFPTRATAGCGTAPSRYSSACSCKPSSTSSTPTASCTPVVSPSNLVKNGGFECGLAPWRAVDIVNTAHKLSSPGLGGSATAYEFDQVGPKGPDSDSNPAYVTQDVSGLTVGREYRLRFGLNFDRCTARTLYVGIKITGPNGEVTTASIDECDTLAANNGVDFTASAETMNIRFEFVIGRLGAVVKLDNVNIIA